MAEYIYIKIGDEFYEQTFGEKFKGIIVQTPRRFIVMDAKTLLKFLSEWESSQMGKDIQELDDKDYFNYEKTI